MEEHAIRIIIITLIIFVINIPFGFLRGRQKKFSFKWFLYLHIPVPVVIFLRIYSDIGFAFYTYPILVGAFFLGQYTGRKFVQEKFRHTLN